MTDWVSFFRTHIQSSADAFVWAALQLRPADRFSLPPEPGYLGTWPAARHVWHVTGYERCLVLPAMQAWLEGAPSTALDWLDEDADWDSAQPLSMECLLDDFHSIRREQVALLEPLAAADWTAPRPTVWGDKSLAWIVTKTLQHTWEHGDTLLRMGLWREHIEAQMAAAGAGTKNKE
jgi:hypothetical protein